MFRYLFISVPDDLWWFVIWYSIAIFVVIMSCFTRKLSTRLSFCSPLAGGALMGDHGWFATSLQTYALMDCGELLNIIYVIFYIYRIYIHNISLFQLKSFAKFAELRNLQKQADSEFVHNLHWSLHRKSTFPVGPTEIAQWSGTGWLANLQWHGLGPGGGGQPCNKDRYLHTWWCLLRCPAIFSKPVKVWKHEKSSKPPTRLWYPYKVISIRFKLGPEESSWHRA